MNFKTELAKLGYNNGNIISVETLVDEILPDLFSKQQERMYSEEDLINLLNFVSKEYNISNGIGWFHTHDSIEDVSSKEVLEQFKKN